MFLPNLLPLPVPDESVASFRPLPPPYMEAPMDTLAPSHCHIIRISSCRFTLPSRFTSHTVTSSQNHTFTLLISHPLTSSLPPFPNFVQIFSTHQISLAELCQMDESHLEVLGIPLGPRIRIVAEIRKLEPLDKQGTVV